MRYECQYKTLPGDSRVIIIDVTDDEIATAERTPGNTEALLIGTAWSNAAPYLPIGATPVQARRLR